QRQYEERLKLTREPGEFKSEILSELYAYALAIQNREEMRNFDEEKKSLGYVPTKVMEIWKSDKRIKSLYHSTQEYCSRRDKNFTLIAIHLAEYRAVIKLIGKMQRSIYKSRPAIQSAEPLKAKPTPKTRVKIPKEAKVRAELQKEIGSVCLFCDNADVGHFHIHHIDESPSNNEIDNLLLVCPNCHSKITKGDILRQEVEKKKNELVLKLSKAASSSGKQVNFHAPVNHAIVGDNNVIKITREKKAGKQKYPPGCIGYDTQKANYISYLIGRYNEYKKYDPPKNGQMDYAVFSSQLKNHFKLGPTRTINHLPTERFDELVNHIQGRIDQTKLARQKGRQHKNYSGFEEYKK
ncbi:MAG TPA: HNH endonuclease, partial [Chitinophagaceae bacterium]|nr:HNH endonuclease [Chitinophagaceae bacterium]